MLELPLPGEPKPSGCVPARPSGRFGPLALRVPGSDALALRCFVRQVELHRLARLLLGCRLNWSPAQLSSAQLSVPPVPAELPEGLLSLWYNCYKRFGLLIATRCLSLSLSRLHSLLTARHTFYEQLRCWLCKTCGSREHRQHRAAAPRDRLRFVCANVCTNCLSPDKRLPFTHRRCHHQQGLPSCVPPVYRLSFIVVRFCFAYDLHEIRFARLRLRGPNRERERERVGDRGVALLRAGGWGYASYKCALSECASAECECKCECCRPAINALQWMLHYECASSAFWMPQTVPLGGRKCDPYGSSLNKLNWMTVSRRK